MKLGPLIRQHAKLTEQIAEFQDINSQPIRNQTEMDQHVAIANKMIEMEKQRESIGRAIERLRNVEN